MECKPVVRRQALPSKNIPKLFLSDKALNKERGALWAARFSMKMSIFQPFSCVFLRMIDVSDIAWKDLPGSAQMLFSKIGQETYSDY